MFLFLHFIVCDAVVYDVILIESIKKCVLTNKCKYKCSCSHTCHIMLSVPDMGVCNTFDI